MDHTSARQVDLMHGPIFRNLLIFAIPIFISNLFQQLYNAADTMIVGNILGDTSLAAVGACGSIYELLVGFGLGIGNGLAIVTARAYGAGDADKVKKTVAGSIVIGLVASALISGVGLVFLYPLLEALDTPPEIIAEAYSYIQPIAQYVVVMFVYNLCAALLRAVGNSVMPLVFLIFSSCLNVALDYWFVAGLGMGVRGPPGHRPVPGGFGGAVHPLHRPVCPAPGAQPPALLGGEEPVPGAGDPGPVHGADEQHCVGGLGDPPVRHQQPGHPGDRRPYRRPEAVHLHRYAGDRHGHRRLHLCLPEPGRRQTPAHPAGDAADLAVCPGDGRGDDRPDVAVCRGAGGADFGFHPSRWCWKNGARYLRWTAPFYSVLGVLLSTRYALQSLGQKVLPLISSGIELVGKILFMLFFIPRFGYNAVILCEPVIWCFMCAQLVWSYWTDPYIKASRKPEACAQQQDKICRMR